MLRLHNPWYWLRNRSLLFGITVRQVDNIFLTYKVAHRVGKLSQQCHLLATLNQYDSNLTRQQYKKDRLKD